MKISKKIQIELTTYEKDCTIVCCQMIEKLVKLMKESGCTWTGHEDLNIETLEACARTVIRLDTITEIEEEEWHELKKV